MSNELRLVVWNVEWAKPGRKRGDLVVDLVEQEQPDVICLTEGRENTFTDRWHTVWGGQDPGYKSDPDKRKVLLSSRNKWELVDDVGDPGMPPGRFLCGKTKTPIGPVWFVAVCIPWAHAHVTSGRKDRKIWDEHLLYLDGLERFLNRTHFDLPAVLLGDFNQRIPRKRNPLRVYERLMQIVDNRFSIISTGTIASESSQSIDHVGLSDEVSGELVKTLPKRTPTGTKLSDHFGLVVSVRR